MIKKLISLAPPFQTFRLRHKPQLMGKMKAKRIKKTLIHLVSSQSDKLP